MTTQSNTQSNEKFFDLHTTGIGYLNRAREVTFKRGEPFLAVDINAMHGSEHDLQQTRFDCRVSGNEAKAVMRNFLMAAVQAKKKVLIGFKLGDLYAETFVYETGEKAGQTGVSLKARLLRILWAKVDGEVVYRAPHETAESQGSEDAGQPASEPMERDAAPVSESLPSEIRLSKDDPEFEQKKQSLKDQGYRWNTERQCWYLPEQRAA